MRRLKKKIFPEKMQEQLNHIKQGKSITGPKISMMKAAILGGKEAIAVDSNVLRSFGINRGSPTPVDFTQIWYYIFCKSKKLGIQPRQLATMLWFGYRYVENGSADDYPDYLS